MIKLVNQDCMAFMAGLSSNSVQYCLTSPPYNMSARSTDDKYQDYADDMSAALYFDNQYQVITEMLRVAERHVFYNIQMLAGNKVALHKLMGAFAEQIKEVIIWHKGFGAPAFNAGTFNSGFEYIIILSNQQPDKRLFNDAVFKQGTASNIFTVQNTHHNAYADVHKAVMPLDLPRKMMQYFGCDNDIWLDPYTGTGTTAIAAIRENKQFMGSELSETYCKLANRRIADELSQLTLF